MADEVHGYLGYETRPSERKKGVAKTLVRCVAQNIIETGILVSCEETNIGSQRVLEAVGAEYIRTNLDKNRNVKIRFYRLYPI